MKGLMKIRTGMGNVEVQEIRDPEPGPGEVLIEVKAAGICGTDLHIWKDEYKSVPPMVMGHEGAGVIAALGEGVSGFSPGDRVTTETFAKFCGHCFFCKQGKINLCPERKSIGTHLNGFFAKYLTIRASAVHLLPEGVSFSAGALSEPVACCVHGVLERASVIPGDWILISGPGTIGLLSLQLAKAGGGKIIVLGMDKDEERLALARDLGADRIINVQREDPVEGVLEATNGLGADMAVECAGAAASFNQCMKLLRKGGRISQGGLFGKPVQADLELVAMKELEIIGFFSHLPSAWDRGLKLMAEGKVLTEPLVSHRLPLTEWKNGFSLMDQGQGLKILLLPVD